MSQLAHYGATYQNVIVGVLTGLVAVLGALIAHRIVYAIARRFTCKTPNHFDDSLVRRSRGPARLIFPLIALMAVSPALHLSKDGAALFRHIVGLVVIAAAGWLAISLLGVFEDMLAARYRMDVADNLIARRVQTQISVIKRVANVVILAVTAGIMLMTFPVVREVGASIFASAGIAALLAGLAARSTFTNLLAGLQIAITEPIRLDDVVIVQGEYGRVEDITTTYVVVKIWDERRMIVPLAKFIEEPFQNWTLQEAQMLGTVFLHTDYTVPVEELRQELQRILKSTDLWDGRVCGLQVTDTTEKTVELRALMSAASSSIAWDLRCLVREKLLTFLQKNYPESLPRTRAELRGVPENLERRSGMAS